MGARQPRSSLADRVGPLTWLAIGGSVVFVAWQLIDSGTPDSRQAIADLAPLMFEVAAVVGLLRAARDRRSSDRGTARALLALAAASMAYFAGDAAWAWLELVEDSSPFPSVADALYLAFHPLLLIGLLAFPASRRSRGEKVRMGLDIAAVVIASTMAVWYVLLGPTVQETEGRSLAAALSLAYPVGDVVLVFAIVVLLLRTEAGALPLQLLAVGLSSFVVGDLGFGRLSLTGNYHAGDWPDTCYVVASALVVIAADVLCHQPLERRRTGDADAGRHYGMSLLPYAGVAGGYLLLLGVARSRAAYPLDGLIVGACGLTGVVVLRQLTALRDNARLTDEFRRIATTDALTGLTSRRHFFDLAERIADDLRETVRPVTGGPRSMSVGR